MSLWFKFKLMIKGRGHYLKVRIHHPDKYTEVKYIKRKGINHFMTENGYYYVQPDRIYDEDGFRTLTYNYNDSIPIYPPDFHRDHEYNAQDMLTSIDAKVTEELFNATKDEGESKEIKSLKILLLVGFGVIGLAMFFVYTELQKTYEIVIHQQEVIEALRELIARGAFD